LFHGNSWSQRYNLISFANSPNPSSSFQWKARSDKGRERNHLLRLADVLFRESQRKKKKDSHKELFQAIHQGWGFEIKKGKKPHVTAFLPFRGGECGKSKCWMHP
jgi:hypothetical protein